MVFFFNWLSNVHAQCHLIHFSVIFPLDFVEFFMIIAQIKDKTLYWNIFRAVVAPKSPKSWNILNIKWCQDSGKCLALWFLSYFIFFFVLFFRSWHCQCQRNTPQFNLNQLSFVMNGYGLKNSREVDREEEKKKLMCCCEVNKLTSDTGHIEKLNGENRRWNRNPVP